MRIGRAIQPKPDRVANPRNCARRAGDVGHHWIGIGISESSGYIVLDLEHESVSRPTSEEMQGNAGGEQRFIGFFEGVEQRLVDECPTRSNPFECMHIAHTATTALEIRAEAKGHLAVFTMHLSNPSAQESHILDRFATPLILRRCSEVQGE